MLVQWGQRVASMSMSVLQKGHFLVVGAAGASGFLPRFISLLMPRIRQKRMNAMMMKLTTADRNAEAR